MGEHHPQPLENWTITISINPVSAHREGDNTDASTIIGHADGSALDNPGPAGWAVILSYPDGSHRTLAGSCEHSTNNRMELTAATEALAAVPDDVPFVLFLDSNYVVKGATLWRPQWETRGWRNANGKPVANRDLWERLYAVLDARPLATLKWVRGHAGNELNEAVDRLARAEAEKVRLALGGSATSGTRKPVTFGRGALQLPENHVHRPY